MAYEIDELRIALEATRQERDVARQLFDKEHAERELLSEALKRTQGNFARSLRSVAEREFGEELVRRVVNLDCQNERPR